MERRRSHRRSLKDRPEWSNRLADARIGRGLTQDQIASELSLPQGTYASYEAGRSEPPIAVFRKLHQVLNLSLDWLLLGQGEMQHATTAPVRDADDAAIRQAAQDIIRALDRRS
ncbi:helix-turn-helix domain-containing protein [Muricoccus radiodurans]|uniref:helix-turn-helix domain-containing protein n=1 Tax=Muricoccus radiodurans TaxID=2231721 RepID=UPI003CEA9E7E